VSAEQDHWADTADPIRARVLASWAASPARFREDANAEEDLALGGYRDRLLVELAQNAADAAVRAGQPGRLSLRLVDGVLSAANTGAPLDGAGVQALATLRASAKRDGGTVGRFGVGFAAVLAVSDAPRVVSATGGVEFSAERTRALVAELPELAGELARRGGAVPVLRLPFGVGGGVLPGFDTEVRLPLRPGVQDAVRRGLAALTAEVLLSLPGLAEIDVDGRRLSRTGLPDGDVELRDGERVRRWRLVSAEGRAPAELLAGRPVEERERSSWSVCWAVPVDDDRVVPLTGRQVVHAPTPSDEPLSLPARLIATYPLAPDRRHVAPGPLTDHVTEQAADAYLRLVTSLGADPVALTFVPSPSLTAGQLDAAVCTAILDRLRSGRWLPGADGGRLTPQRAATLDAASPELVEVLRDVVPGLLPAEWSTRTRRPVLDSLGVALLGPAAVVDALSTVDRPGAWWHAVYAALDGWRVTDDREALSALPVPLADGRTAYGARGLLIAEPGLAVDELAGLRLRLVAAAAAHPLLERLGARPATAAAILLDPDARAAVAASLEDEDPEPVAAGVLVLVEAGGGDVSEHPWLADLALPDEDGGWSAAGELVLPGSPLADVLEPAALGVVADAAVQRWGAGLLTSTGVLTGFVVAGSGDIELGDDLDVDGGEDWYDAVLDRLPETPVPPRLHGVLAVRDLEQVRPDRWPAALRMLSALPSEVFAPVVASLPDDTSRSVPSYTTWWLSTHPVLEGQRPDRLRRNGSIELSGLYDEAPATAPSYLDCPSTVDGLLADVESALDLLYRLGDPGRAPQPYLLGGIYGRAASALAGVEVRPPSRVRDVSGQVVARETAAVLDVPYVLPLLDRSLVGAAGRPGEVADLLGLPLASELVDGRVTSGPGRRSSWRELPGAALAARRLGHAELPGDVHRHDGLAVDGRAVPWWAVGGIDHVDAAGGAEALGRALAWRHGAWALRAALSEAFAHPHAAGDRAAEDSLSAG